MPNTTDDFFEAPEAQSRLKATIVSKYFDAWTRIRHYSSHLAFVDLFCGPGAYEDGTDSTPLLVIDKALGSTELPSKLSLFFNDKESEHVAALAQRIATRSGIGRFTHGVSTSQVDTSDEGALSALLDTLPTCPTFFFVDPFGYKGLTRSLLRRLMSGEGAECLFFFNYRRINANLNNPVLSRHSDRFFGVEEAGRLRRLVLGLDPETREHVVMDAVQDLVQSLGALVPLTFRIYSAHSERTSHYLVFATKHFKGYEVMRDVMAKECVFLGQEMPLYEYNPAPPPETDPQLSLWVDPTPDPFSQLRDDLKLQFAGRTLTVRQLFEKHSLGQPYLLRHYRFVLMEFEERGLVTIDPPSSARRKGTLKETALVTFGQGEIE